MELSLEIPKANLKSFHPLVDFKFGLAHFVLEDKEYAKEMEGCLLDNGMYELNEPLPIPDLVEAVKRCKPRAVIGPDKMDDMNWTLKSSRGLVYALEINDLNVPVGIVVQGANLDERMKFLDYIYAEGRHFHWSPVCFPFRSPRIETLREAFQRGHIYHGEWYHLLGLAAYKDLLIDRVSYTTAHWSIDTGKPFKGFLFGPGEELRGHGKLDHDARIESDTDLARACYNIAYMRRMMHGPLPTGITMSEVFK